MPQVTDIQLKAYLDANINTNYNREITGAKHNYWGTDIIDSKLNKLDAEAWYIRLDGTNVPVAGYAGYLLGVANDESGFELTPPIWDRTNNVVSLWDGVPAEVLIDILSLINNAATSRNTFSSSGIDGAVDWTSDTQLVSAKAINSLANIASTWGNITGDIFNQTDLQTEFNTHSVNGGTW